MRIDIKPSGGILTVTSRYGREPIQLAFDPDTLQNWYPFNAGYTYKTNNAGEIQLAREVGARFMPKIEGVHTLNAYVWYNKSVRDDNLRVAKFASAMGIASPFEQYRNYDVTEGMQIVGNTIDALTVHYTQEYLATASKQYSSNQEGEALRNVSDEGKYLYAKVGEVYTMLNMMRKVTTHNGFGRPVKPPVWGTN